MHKNIFLSTVILRNFVLYQFAELENEFSRVWAFLLGKNQAVVRATPLGLILKTLRISVFFLMFSRG
jgi:hypothetical protein